ncbi:MULTISPECIES: Crp/Fnr family transcriptional regulator [Capnocytophaga]|nr:MULTISPECIES: Crp/Fnr family transcriptional regulator [Capnocytophaga]CEN36351.1 putative transcriptional regulator, Crp/Fnr family [Capnocytophaga cynodegmi]CEN39287.1 putative transcriptional regulator, Crp/Fnr family [Capnocytophaga cynodegmi]
METAHLEIISFVSQIIPIDETAKRHIIEAFEPIETPKNTLLEREGKPTQFLYFINKGFVRVYHIDNGEDRTTQINCPSRFITSFQSFITHTPAYDNVQTITDCELLRISKSKLDDLNKKISHWNIFREKLYQTSLMFNEERNRDMILLNAEGRYKKLMKTQPEILKNVPLQFIASYIGIKPESLSRIRRQLIS